MKRLVYYIAKGVATVAAMFVPMSMLAAAPAEVQLLPYSAVDGSTGLRLAWRTDSASAWTPIGNDYNFVSSDFGPWGDAKKMYVPILTRDCSGLWTAKWIADKEDGVIATATSPDLTTWSPQRYTLVAEASAPTLATSIWLVDSLMVSGRPLAVERSLVDTLVAYTASREARKEHCEERAKHDGLRFATLPASLTYTVNPDRSAAKPISDKLIGIFFEDINYAADGGLYAEMVQNRDFEYRPADRHGDSKWNALTAWQIVSPAEVGSIAIDSIAPIHTNNPHYLRLNAAKSGLAVANSGYDGIPVKKGATYRLSLRARSSKPMPLTVSTVGSNGKTLTSTRLVASDSNWKEYKSVLKAKATDANCRLVVTAGAPGTADIDMVSLFPTATFHGRTNGLRADLAQTLADLHPRFVRFPGGCVAHGDGVDNIYDWKGSVGPLEARRPLRNLWGYHQTRGLGYHEYFQLCEDIGAEPLPVLAAGVPCQNSGDPAHHTTNALTHRGQQCGIPMEEMDAYVADVLDLIEYANGDTTTRWGAMRAAAGHPEPFGLKMIGIGNEDMITEVFIPRFKMIYEAVRQAHPEIEVVGTVGPFYEGTDYNEGWRLARELSVPMVDEHYYVDPGWMIYNQDYYDSYPRGATRVYLGEYAAHLPNRPSNVETALAEALYLTAVERNADVVAMTSYAPLLAKKGHTQWKPDLIYFTNTEVRPTVNYHVQKLFGNNSADCYIPAATNLSTADAKACARVGSSLLYDKDSGDYILKMVNLLPRPVEASVATADLDINPSAKVALTTLTGRPDDSTATPEQSTALVPADGNLTLTLPPYSLIVARIPSLDR